MMRDYCGDVIETLADSEASLLDQVVELTIERDSYKLLARQAVHLLHARHIETERLRVSYHRLLDERRATREAA